MPQYVVSYDLHQAGRDYERIRKGLASLGEAAKILESVWLVDSARTAAELRDHLKGYCDGNDGILVIEMASNWATVRVSDEGLGFLQKHRP